MIDIQRLQTRTLAQLSSLLRHRQERGLPLTPTLASRLTDIAQMHPKPEEIGATKAYRVAHREFVEAARAVGVLLN